MQEIEALYADKEEAAEQAGVQAQSAEAAQAAEEYEPRWAGSRPA